MNGKPVSIREAARFLGVHPNTMPKWSVDKVIPSYRVGRRRDRRFELEALSAYSRGGGIAGHDGPTRLRSP